MGMYCTTWWLQLIILHSIFESAKRVDPKSSYQKKKKYGEGC